MSAEMTLIQFLRAFMFVDFLWLLEDLAPELNFAY